MSLQLQHLPMVLTSRKNRRYLFMIWVVELSMCQFLKQGMVYLRLRLPQEIHIWVETIGTRGLWII